MKTKHLALACFALVAGSAFAAPGGRHVLVVGIGGCRPDALQPAGATNLLALAQGGAVAWTAYAGGNTNVLTQPTLSGPGWSSVLTGVWSNKHGVSDNSYAGYNTNFPHFFKRIRQAAPTAQLSSIVESAALDAALAAPFAADFDLRQTALPGATTDLVAKAVAHLSGTDPDVLFIEFDAVELAGTASGYSAANPSYLAALAGVDAGIGRILGAMRARPSYASEQWLVLVTSDHAGSNTNSGGQSPDERTILAIANGPGIAPGRLVTPGPGQTFVPPTVLAWLGLHPPAQWGFDSPLFGLPLATDLRVYLDFDGSLAAAGATTNPAAVLVGTPRFTNGIAGSAATFTNTGSSGVCEDWCATLGSKEWLYTNDFTVAMWLRFTLGTGDGAFIGNKDWNSGYNTGWVVSKFSKSVNWTGAGSTRQDVWLQSLLGDGAWHQLTVSFQRGANRVTTYCDGLARSSLALDTLGGLASLNAGYATLIGASGPGSYGVNGSLDELALWTRALDAGEANELYLLGQSGLSLTNTTWTPPRITMQPVATNVPFGAPAGFSVSYAGLYASCQWYCNGIALAGATNSSFTLPFAQPLHAGGYSVTVSNQGGVVTSAVAALTVDRRPAAVVTNGLVLHLPLDGSLAAGSGTPYSAIVATGAARYTAGRIGQAACFSNAPAGSPPGDWAATLGTNLETVYAGSFTVSLWVRTTNTVDGALLGNKNWASGGNVGWVIDCFPGEQVNYATAGGSRVDIGLHPPLCDGGWHHVVVAFDRAANEARVYLDGVLRATNAIGATGSAGLNAGYPTLLGASGPGGYAGQGDLDDLAMWNRPLALEEIRSVYFNGLDGQSFALAPAIAGQARGGRLTLTWPLSGFVLQSTTSLAGGTWTALPASTNSVVLPLDGESRRFYRLSN